jgi:ubiquinone/menaquinone biosynthesis C-methylase UbiE
LQVALQQKGVFTAGADRSPQMSRQAAGRLRKHGLPISVTRASAQSLPFPSEYFEQAISTFPSEYVFDPSTISEVRRVLAPAGQWRILLSAYPKGRDVLRAVVRLLLRADGQVDPALLEKRLAPMLETFKAGGFDVRIELRPVGESDTLWIICLKQDTGG